MKSLIALAGLGWLLWRWDTKRRSSLDAASPQASAAPNRGPLNTWENEGGALHGTGAQIGPDPEHRLQTVEQPQGQPA
jgi:hypothetical protein